MCDLSLQACRAMVLEARAAELRFRVAARRRAAPYCDAWGDALTARLEAESSLASLDAAQALSRLGSSRARRVAASGAC